MDPAGFLADLELIPERLDHLAGSLASIPPVERRPRTLLLGMGSSAYAGQVVARAARRTGRNVWVELASAEDLPPPGDDLTVIAVSASGGSAEVLRAIEPYAEGGSLVAVTNDVDSPLAAATDHVVPMHAGPEPGGVACRSYRHTIAVLLLALDVVPRAELADVLRASAAANAELLQRTWLPQTLEVLGADTDRTLLAFLAPPHLQGSAAQSALMVREGPRRLAVASDTGDWSHVDVYLSKNYDYRAVLFAGSPWDAAALEWLRQRQRPVITVGAVGAIGAVGAPDDTAPPAIRYRGDSEHWVRALTEPAVGELLAHRWWTA